MEKVASKKVKVGSVSFTIYPWEHRSGKTHYRFAWYDLNGRRNYTTRAKKADAIQAARDKAREIHNQTFDLSNLSEENARLCRAFLDLNPDWDDVAALKKRRTLKAATLSEIIELFMQAKEEARGRSRQNVKTLTSHSSRLETYLGKDAQFAEITVNDLDGWIASYNHLAARTRNNMRDTLVTIWRWAKKKEYLPQDQLTAAEKTEEAITVRKIPDTFSPAQLNTMLANVRDKYRTWIILQAWAGLRTDELFPLTKSEKSPLDWSDLDFDRRLILVRPETDKNGRRRIIPMCDALYEALLPLKKDSGRITPKALPSSGNHPETKRLGDLVGGWGTNPLRHSAVSYRCALVGVAQTAMESGNSESEIKRSYLDMKSKEDAEIWFKLRNL